MWHSKSPWPINKIFWYNSVQKIEMRSINWPCWCQFYYWRKKVSPLIFLEIWLATVSIPSSQLILETCPKGPHYQDFFPHHTAFFGFFAQFVQKRPCGAKKPPSNAKNPRITAAQPFSSHGIQGKYYFY